MNLAEKNDNIEHCIEILDTLYDDIELSPLYNDLLEKQLSIQQNATLVAQREKVRQQITLARKVLEQLSKIFLRKQDDTEQITHIAQYDVISDTALRSVEHIVRATKTMDAMTSLLQDSLIGVTVPIDRIEPVKNNRDFA